MYRSIDCADLALFYQKIPRLLICNDLEGLFWAGKNRFQAAGSNCLLERAKKQKNVVELQEIKEVFQKGSLTQAQLEGIVSYLEERKIDVLTMSEIDSDEM